MSFIYGVMFVFRAKVLLFFFSANVLQAIKESVNEREKKLRKRKKNLFRRFSKFLFEQSAVDLSILFKFSILNIALIIIPLKSRLKKNKILLKPAFFLFTEWHWLSKRRVFYYHWFKFLKNFVLNRYRYSTKLSWVALFRRIHQNQLK
jgi:hypothetical protein